MFGIHAESVIAIKPIKLSKKKTTGTTFVKFDSPYAMVLAQSYAKQSNSTPVKFEIAKHDMADETNAPNKHNTRTTEQENEYKTEKYIVGVEALMRNAQNFIVRPHMDFIFLAEDTTRMNNKMNGSPKTYNQIVSDMISKCYFDLVKSKDRFYLAAVGEDENVIVPFEKRSNLKDKEDMMKKLHIEESHSAGCRIIESFISVLEMLKKDRQEYQDARERDICIIAAMYDFPKESDQMIRTFIEKIHKPGLPHFHFKIISMKQYNKNSQLGKEMDNIIEKKMSHFTYTNVNKEEALLKQAFKDNLKHIVKYNRKEETMKKLSTNSSKMFIDNKPKEFQFDFSESDIHKTIISKTALENITPKNITTEYTATQHITTQHITEENEIIETVDPFKNAMNKATRIISASVLEKEEYFNLNTLFRRSTGKPMKNPLKGDFDTLSAKISRHIPVELAKVNYQKIVNKLFNKYIEQIEKIETVDRKNIK